MFEVSITLMDESGSRQKVVKTDSFGLFVNRYPVGHPMAGEIRDIRLWVKEGKGMVDYAFVVFTVKEVSE